MAQQKNINTLARLVTGESWPEPIPVGEMLPNNHEDVLCFVLMDESDSGGWNVGCLEDGNWVHSWNVGGDVVTHWLPLPPSPQQH